MARSERNPKPWLGALLGGVVFAAVAHAVPPSVSPPPSELEVRAECSANAESGYVVLFFESSQRQAGRRILSIGCGRGRDCTAAALRVPPDGVLRLRPHPPDGGDRVITYPALSRIQVRVEGVSDGEATEASCSTEATTFLRPGPLEPPFGKQRPRDA